MPQYHIDVCHGSTWSERIVSYCKLRWLDWLTSVIFCILGGTASQFVTPPTRFFVERDPMLSFPYRSNARHEVPTSVLVVLVAVPTLVIIYLVQLTFRCCHRNRSRDAITSTIYFWDLPLLTLSQAVGAELIITDVLKEFQGRYRPFFFAACNYKGYADAIAASNFTNYLANTVPGMPGDVKHCLVPFSDYKDAILSNPSGHASAIFAGWTILALTVLFLLRSQAKYWPAWSGKVWVMFLVIFPFIGAELVTATRTRDYAHNFDDTLHGTLIGIGCGALAFFLNYGLRPAGHVRPPNDDDDIFGKMESQRDDFDTDITASPR